MTVGRADGLTLPGLVVVAVQAPLGPVWGCSQGYDQAGQCRRSTRQQYDLVLGLIWRAKHQNEM